MFQKLYWPFTVWINCSGSDLKTFANSGPSAWNFKSFSRSLEQFFLTVGQNNFGNKITFLKKPNKVYYLASCSSWQAWAKSFSNASFSMSSILALILGSSIELEIILAFQKLCSLLNFSFSVPHKGNFSCKTVMTGFGTVAGYLEPASR